MRLVEFTDDLVVPASGDREVTIKGYPPGSWLNFISWSDDSKHVAFTIRSPGEHAGLSGSQLGPTPPGC